MKGCLQLNELPLPVGLVEQASVIPTELLELLHSRANRMRRQF